MYIDEKNPLVYGVRPEPEHSIVPEGHYLLLGDNSPHSQDGRYFGWVPEGNMLGRAFCTWWPIGRWRDFTGFTDTWWGVSLLYGIPLLILLYELLTGFAVFSWRVREGFGDALRKGERVIVNRLPFGVRLPLLGVRLVNPRSAIVGEYVLVEPSPSEAPVEGPFLARVVTVGATPKSKGREDGLSVAPEGAENSPLKITPDRLLGTVVAVWRPLRNRRSIKPAGGA
jgi:hypothetical protein